MEYAGFLRMSGEGQAPWGMGNQAPAEPLTFEPEVCLVTSWGCHQGQIPLPSDKALARC